MPTWLRGLPRRLMWSLCLLCGCSSAGGGLFGLTPQGQRLSESARGVRQNTVVAVPRELDKRVAPAYVVEPGDTLLVVAADVDSPVRLPGDQPVLPDGTIQLGRYGRVPVAGRTVEEIEGIVKPLIDAQTKDAGPIVVRLVTRASKVFYVVGEVNAPGAFTLSGRETVLDAILLAGGVTQRASRNNTILSRPTSPDSCRVVLPVCYDDIVQLGDTSTNYQIAAGDRVFVPARTFMEELCPEKHGKGACGVCGQPQSACPLPPYEGHHAVEGTHP